MRFLVVGCGSIGERHIRNLKSLGFEDISVCDLRSEQLVKIEEKYKINKTYNNLSEALKNDIDAVLVCTPNVTHIPIVRTALDSNCHVFVEKPLSHSLDGVDEVIEEAAKKDLVLMVGFNLRFHPNLQKIKELLEKGRIGKVTGARVEFGYYLPNWHPYEDYREGYSAQQRLGGGIIFDAIHELDYIRWFLGEVAEVFCFADKLSSLKINTEDSAEILLRFKSGIFAEIHLDYIQRAYSRSCKIIGEEGTILWDFNEKTVKLFDAEEEKWHYFVEEDFDFNRTYVNEIKHFIQCIKNEKKPLIEGEEEKKILEIAMAAKRSAEIGEVIRL